MEAEVPMDYGTLIGVIASVFTAISLIPQLIKVLREKKADDVSILTLLVLLTEVLLWMYYGIIKKDWIIAISNFMALIINIAIVVFTLKYRTARTKTRN